MNSNAKHGLAKVGPGTDALTTRDEKSLAKCERVIEKGIKTFIEVGTALAEIREGRLYRATHKTFRDYCGERWGFSDSRARQLIGAAKVAESVTGVTVSNEATARAINSVPDARREQVVEAATGKSDGKPLTAASIRQAAAEVVEPVEVTDAPGDPTCPDCGSTDFDEDEVGQFCCKCRASLGDQTEVIDQDTPDNENWWIRGRRLLRDALRHIQSAKARELIEEVIYLLEHDE